MHAPPRLAVLALLPLLAVPAAGLGDGPLPACLERRDAPAGLPGAGLDDHPPGPDGCIGAIRPGALMTAPAGCTFNFVFRDGAGGLYIGTAGHCVNGVGQRVAAQGVGPFGSVVFRRVQGVHDFALVRIDPAFHGRVSPTLCAWGGPVAPDPGSRLPRDLLLEYGWGFATSATSATRARALVETQTYPTHVTWTGLGSGGDSGAPVVNQAGFAVAIHTFGQTPFAGVALEGGPTIANVLAMGRTAVPGLHLVPGDATSLEHAMRGLTY